MQIVLTPDERSAVEKDFDWARFERDLLFKTLDPLTLRVGQSGFRAILRELELPRGCDVLDVGAGGFVGANTTRPLVEVLDARVDAVEINPDLAAKLRDAFPQANVICADIFDFDPGDKTYSLIVFDLPIIDRQFNELIPRYTKHLKQGGYIVSDIVYDLYQVFDGREPLLDASRRGEFETFMTGRFGALRLDVVSAQRAFHGTPLTVRGMVDKWLCRNGNARGFGWLVMQKGEPGTLGRRPLLARMQRGLRQALFDR